MTMERHEWVRTMKSEEVVIDQVSLAWRCKRVMYFTFKRIFDICCSLVGMIFLIPLLIIIKIAYMCSGDFKSVLYSQERIGKNGKIFRLHKFRSMVPNADEVLEELLEKNPQIKKEYSENKKIKNDPRITKVGYIIRKFSLDEFPQFINVFLGQMSLVGNRPYLPKEKKDMGKYYEEIIKTKPGITGLWQVSGRSDLTFKRRLELEAQYSNSISLHLDIKIIINTFRAVFKGEGAM